MLFALDACCASRAHRVTVPAPAGAAASPSPRRRLVLAFAALLALTAGLAFGPDHLGTSARSTLIVFAAATLAWAVLRLPETPVALAAVLALVALGVAQPEDLYASMGADLIWLLIGAFVLAAVLRQSGVAERLALAAVAGAGSVGSLFRRLTLMICATAFVVPSTSGRAALLLPVFLALAGALREPALVRGLALLFPSVILLSACASLLGAGAHLVAVDFMVRYGLPPLGFLDWAVLGTPFALLSSLLACTLILRLFVGPAESRAAAALPPPPAGPMTPQQRNVLAIAAATVALWASSALHGIDAPIIALLGALAATWKAATGIAMKEAVKAVEWNLILFLALTLVLGHALIDTGAARWIADAAVAALPRWVLATPPLVLAFAASTAMLSHLVVTSRSARAMVLIPTLALPLAAGGVDAAALIFLSVVASGFCQTLPVSAKPVALYARLEVETYSPADLLRLSLWLMPGFAVLLLVFALWLWPALGLAAASP